MASHTSSRSSSSSSSASRNSQNETIASQTRRLRHLFANEEYHPTLLERITDPQQQQLVNTIFEMRRIRQETYNATARITQILDDLVTTMARTEAYQNVENLFLPTFGPEAHDRPRLLPLTVITNQPGITQQNPETVPVPPPSDPITVIRQRIASIQHRIPPPIVISDSSSSGSSQQARRGRRSHHPRTTAARGRPHPHRNPLSRQNLTSQQTPPSPGSPNLPSNAHCAQCRTRGHNYMECQWNNDRSYPIVIDDFADHFDDAANYNMDGEGNMD